MAPSWPNFVLGALPGGAVGLLLGVLGVGVRIAGDALAPEGLAEVSVFGLAVHSERWTAETRGLVLETLRETWVPVLVIAFTLLGVAVGVAVERLISRMTSPPF
jgi:hypothetical protein